MLQDERDLMVITGISAIFILVALSQSIGMIYAAMALFFGIYLNQKKARIIEFTKGKSEVGKAIFYSFIGLMGFTAVAAIVLGSQEAFVAAVTTFASAFLVNFTIDNFLIRFVVFGFFVPVVETLFFFGVVYPFLLKHSRATNTLNDTNTLVSIAMVAGIATAFHFVVRLLNDQSLLADLVFFGSSAAVVTAQGEMSGAALMHIGMNSFAMGKIGGII